MALTLESNYKTALQGGAFQESWLFEIRNNTYTNGSVDTQYIRLGTEEVGSGDTKYNSFIINKPTIRESIDLEKGTAKTGNMTITCTNGTLSNHSAKLSAEIFNGTRFYMNHQVVVYSKVGSISSGDYLKIFTGRVKDIKVNDKQEVTIVIASATPIDFIKIPDKQSNSGNYFPTIYGNYKPAPASTIGSPGFIDSDTDTLLHPVAVDTIVGEVGYNCLLHADLTTVFDSAVDSGFNTGGLGDQSLLADVTDNSFQITNGSIPADFEAGKIIQIDSEKMLITASTFVPSTFVSIVVIRAYAGTTLAAHADGADIYSVAISSGNSKLHYPVSDALRNADDYPLFAPLHGSSGFVLNKYETQNASGDLIVDNDRKISQTPLDLERRYKYRPKITDLVTQLESTVSPSNQAGNVSSSIAEDSTNNRTKAIDTSNSTFAQFTHNVSFSSSVGTTETDVIDKVVLKFNNTKEDHKVTEYKLTVIYDVASYNDGLSGSDQQQEYQVRLRTYAKYASGLSSNDTDLSYEENVTNRTKQFDLLSTSDFTNADGNPPSETQVSFEFLAINANGNNTASSVVKIKDIFITVRAKIVPESDSDVNPLEHESAVKGVKTLYSGLDGASKSFGTGIVENIVDMHRDILSRHAGISSSANDVYVNTGTYANLSSIRADWKVAYWLDKQLDINKLLEKCQFEGGFVFRFRTSDETPQYIYIPNGTITVDHKIGLSDISSFSLGVTPVDKLISKRIIKYKRSPINDKHLKEQTSEDSSNSIRSNYNVKTNENIETNKLDILIDGIGATDTGSGNRNDGFANYYRYINGVPKLIANIELLNPESSLVGSNYFYGMEVGDFCQFESSVSAVLPMFGGTFSGNSGSKFIVTSITRAAGSLKVTLREI